MSDKEQYFHFTIGPVQSFVGQARRTRDFWAGSFLLSWLSGVAMQSVIKQQRRLLGNHELETNEIILFPLADKKFLDAITKGDRSGPKQGSIPNRFKASVSADFKPKQVVEDVQTAWQALAKTIYEKEIANHALNNTQAIWDRQIKHFWDMNWVLVDNTKDSSSLDRRKNWRSHYMPEEAGIKCSLMGDWQELSGEEGVRSVDRTARTKFWGKLAKGKKNNFSDKEHLSAMSYIKRRFLSYFTDFKVELSDFTAYGWELPTAVPSVSYIAAALWYAKVLEGAKDNEEKLEKLDVFFKEAKQLYELSEYDSTISCIENASSDEEAKQLDGLSKYDITISCIENASSDEKYKRLDGNAFHEIALDNVNTTPNQLQAQEKVKPALKAISKDYGTASPFYAVLMMDGDSLGKQMGDTEKQTAITEGLGDFIKKVPGIVYQHNGFLIYVGGDDVLALVTLEDALSCALEIRQHYEKCFKEKKAKSDIETSISAAIIYAHINSPLKNILHEAHELLDDIAKEKAGRDALAVRVYKGSGLAVEWAKKWDKDIELESKETVIPSALKQECYVLSEIISQFDKAQQTNEQFSSNFFYKIRQRFDLLYGKDKTQVSENPLSAEQAIDLMAMEYLQSVDKKGLSMTEARSAVTPLIGQSYNAAKGNRITVDAALLVRFLTQKGIEGGRS